MFHGSLGSGGGRPHLTHSRDHMMATSPVEGIFVLLPGVVDFLECPQPHARPHKANSFGKGDRHTDSSTIFQSSEIACLLYVATVNKPTR